MPVFVLKLVYVSVCLPCQLQICRRCRNQEVDNQRIDLVWVVALPPAFQEVKVNQWIH